MRFTSKEKIGYTKSTEIYGLGRTLMRTSATLMHSNIETKRGNITPSRVLRTVGFPALNTFMYYFGSSPRSQTI